MSARCTRIEFAVYQTTFGGKVRDAVLSEMVAINAQVELGHLVVVLVSDPVIRPSAPVTDHPVGCKSGIL